MHLCRVQDATFAHRKYPRGTANGTQINPKNTTEGHPSTRERMTTCTNEQTRVTSASRRTSDKLPKILDKKHPVVPDSTRNVENNIEFLNALMAVNKPTKYVGFRQAGSFGSDDSKCCEISSTRHVYNGQVQFLSRLCGFQQ